ncbi:MAG: glycoside hydrolase family 16 protein [Pseudomonadota bacterium]
MKKIKLHLVFAGLCGLTACGGGTAGSPAVTPPPVATPVIPAIPAGGVPSGWKLVWADEFNTDGQPDAAKWDFDTSRNKLGWYNNELQYYSRNRPENSRMAGGKLIIAAIQEKMSSAADYGGQNYTSARMLTRGKAEWTYGFFEVRAKLPCGLGTWPAIWMLGQAGDWPLQGEIDIMEHVGKKKGEVLGTVHTAAYNHTLGTQKGAATMVPDACDVFHNYQLKWDMDQIVIGVDNKYFFQFVNPKDGDLKKWPFSAPQYLLLNLAIGGDLGGPVDDAIFPVQMEIDYVRVYQP